MAPTPGSRRVRYLEEIVGAASVALSASDLAADAAVPHDSVVGARDGDMSSIDAKPPPWLL